MSFIFLRNRVTGGAAFSPASLFASGEQGAWYEPSPTTCFTDTAGTTAAGVGDAVARINDLSGNGNHATQATAAARPILARVPSGGRRNLLERTEEFDDAYWTKQNATVAANLATAPDGQTTAEKLTPDSGTYVNTPIVFILADQTVETRTLTAYMKAAEYDKGFLRVGGSNSLDTSPIAVYDLSAGTVLSSQGTSVVASISSVGDGWYRCRLTYKNGPQVAGTGQAYAPNIGCVSDTYSVTTSGVLTTTDGTSGIYIWGAQLEAASSASAYQKVVDQYDITEAGVTSLEYLAFDGTDDWLITSTVDFTATDEMNFFAGVKRNANGVLYLLAEFADANQDWSLDNGRFVTFTNTSNQAGFAVKGSEGSVSQGGSLGITTFVYSGLAKISTDTNIVRVDGSQVSSVTTNLGVGNFGSSLLSIGARNTTAVSPLDGHIYGLIVRNATSTAQEISDTETYLAAKSGVTL